MRIQFNKLKRQEPIQLQSELPSMLPNHLEKLPVDYEKKSR